MGRRAVTAIVAATALTLPAVALAESHARAQLDHSGADYSRSLKSSSPGALKHQQTSVVSGVVSSIDSKARFVTLQTEGGQTVELQVRDGVKNFDAVAVGDVVKATYTESVAFHVVPNGAAREGVSQAMDKFTGKSKIGESVTSSFTVLSVDPVTNVLAVKMPNGNTEQVRFAERAQTRLTSLNPGDVISATYTSAAIRFEKLPK